jgi:hypothetical protein
VLAALYGDYSDGFDVLERNGVRNHGTLAGAIANVYKLDDDLSRELWLDEVNARLC